MNENAVVTGYNIPGIAPRDFPAGTTTTVGALLGALRQAHGDISETYNLEVRDGKLVGTRRSGSKA